jgi:uncharacterized lipoprotein YmbA
MKFASVVLLLLIAGCANQVIEPSYYLLRSDRGADTRALKPSSDYSLGTVAIASYVDQPSMLMTTQSGEIRPARHHLWAEPMYEGVRSFLVVEISANKGEDIFPTRLNKTAIVVEVRINQLHGTYDGKAVLVAFWWLQKDDKVLSSYQFSETLALTSDGYGALADAHKALLAQLAEKISDSMVD